MLPETPIHDFPFHFPVEGEHASKHRAVLVRIPSTCIDGIVLGGKLAKNSAKVEAILQMVAESGLSIGVYDVHGERLSAQTPDLNRWASP